LEQEIHIQITQNYHTTYHVARNMEIKIYIADKLHYNKKITTDVNDDLP